jgi:hypothetical protein
MINKSGLNNIVKNLTPTSKGNNSKSTKSTFIGRVVDIILDENHKNFKTEGGYPSIGTIYFEYINNGNNGLIFKAKPLNSYLKIFPVINELVSIISSPTLTNSPTYKNEFYYSSVINIWNHPNHNASPNYLKYNSSSQTNPDYDNTVLLNSSNTVPRDNTVIELNSSNTSQNTFKENPNIRPLQPFMGDIIHEGRFGNSIRFSSTSKSQSTNQNNWSKSGEETDPILIIKNGQSPTNKGEGYIPVCEDINNDLSSIYLTSHQIIPINIPRIKYNSFLSNSKPESPSTYKSPQIILNSDRILLNSKKDNVLIHSQKSISLSANNSFNVDSPETIIASQIIKLGGQDANEALIKGNTLYNKLDQLCNALLTLSKTLESSQIYPGGVPTPDPILSFVASNFTTQIEDIQFSLKDILSKQNKTI